jgi:hypothetical protein
MGFCLAASAPEQSARVELGVVPFFEKSRFRFVVAEGGSTGVRGTTRWYSPPARCGVCGADRRKPVLSPGISSPIQWLAM